MNPLLSKNIAYFEAVEVIWIYSPPRLPCPPCLYFPLIHHVYLVLVHPVHLIHIALVLVHLVHLVHLVGGSGDGRCHELSQNIWFELLKFVHLVLAPTIERGGEFSTSDSFLLGVCSFCFFSNEVEERKEEVTSAQLSSSVAQ